MIAFTPGDTLGPNDLDIIVRDENAKRIDPFSITYSVLLRENGDTIVFGLADKEPVRKDIGTFFANFVVPSDANPSDYIIKWSLKKISTSPTDFVEQEFAIFCGESPSDVSTAVESHINLLRLLLRDDNPDRNYHFRPPSWERDDSGFTRRFSFIWEDFELLGYLQLAIADLNVYPPLQSFTLDTVAAQWQGLLIQRAAIYALTAITTNWIADEFGYSIGGKSLDLDKASKYQSLRSELNSDWTSFLERAKKSVKITKGLASHPFIFTSRLGPHTGRSTRSYRNIVRARTKRG